MTDESEIAYAARAAIIRLIPCGRPTVAHVARELGLSTRGLQRHLSMVDLSHSKLVAEIQFELAHEYLVHTRLPILEIASRVGYLDTAHFSRAFLRWTGVSPRRYRMREAKR